MRDPCSQAEHNQRQTCMHWGARSELEATNAQKAPMYNKHHFTSSGDAPNIRGLAHIPAGLKVRVHLQRADRGQGFDRLEVVQRVHSALNTQADRVQTVHE